MKRADVFARDGHRCAYCGLVYPAEMLTLDHVQPRVRAGDRTAGNLVTACSGCNLLKGHLSLAEFLAENPVALENFFRHATHVWPRHLRAVEDELRRGGLRRLSAATRQPRRRTRGGGGEGKSDGGRGCGSGEGGGGGSEGEGGGEGESASGRSGV